VWSVSISADGEYIAAGSSDQKVYLFDKDGFLWNYTTYDYVTSVAISADGEYIVAGSQDTKVYLFDKDSSTPLWRYNTIDMVNSVAISADGEYIVASSWGFDDSKQYLFDKSGDPLWSYSSTGSASIDISADGEYIVAGEKFSVSLFDKTPAQGGGGGDGQGSTKITEDNEDEESSLPSVSMIPALISVGLVARYRRK
jgi:WD40 repeat protein